MIKPPAETVIRNITGDTESSGRYRRTPKMRYGSYLAPRVPHKWLISDKTVVGILSLGLVLTFIGVVLVAVGHVSTG